MQWRSGTAHTPEQMRNLFQRESASLLMGDGIEREQLQRLATKLAPGKVYFLDHITDREYLAELYASCDLFVHPNPREPFPIAPLEAMASGLLLVAASAGGITSFATEGNAWPAEPHASAFAAAILQAMQEDAARMARVRAALVTAAERGWDRAALAYFASYEAIHAAFRGLDWLEFCPPEAYSTPATAFSGPVITASPVMAQTLFRILGRVSSQTWGHGRKNLPQRYVQVVPSVTAKEEKQRPFCIQEGQT